MLIVSYYRFGSLSTFYIFINFLKKKKNRSVAYLLCRWLSSRKNILVSHFPHFTTSVSTAYCVRAHCLASPNFTSTIRPFIKLHQHQPRKFIAPKMCSNILWMSIIFISIIVISSSHCLSFDLSIYTYTYIFFGRAKLSWNVPTNHEKVAYADAFHWSIIFLLFSFEGSGVESGWMWVCAKNVFGHCIQNTCFW